MNHDFYAEKHVYLIIISFWIRTEQKTKPRDVMWVNPNYNYRRSTFILSPATQTTTKHTNNRIHATFPPHFFLAMVSSKSISKFVPMFCRHFLFKIFSASLSIRCLSFSWIWLYDIIVSPHTITENGPGLIQFRDLMRPSRDASLLMNRGPRMLM